MRISFVIHRLSCSGAPKMLAWVANQMAKRGHEVHVITFFTGEQAQMLGETVTLHNLDIPQSTNRIVRNSAELAKAQYKLLRRLKQIKPDVIVSFHSSGTYIHLLLNKLFGRYPVIFSERADPNAHKGMKKKLFEMLMNCANGTVFQTEGARACFSGKIYENSTVIPNPAVLKPKVAENLPKYLHTYENRDNRIVSVGRLSIAQKRQDVLLDAFQIVHNKHPEMQLVLYGSGEDMEKIRALTAEKDLADCVVLAGNTNQVEENICSARAFALTSDYEGIPNALIEALTVGVPCVSTDCSPGGAALLIRDGENGFLVPRGDAEAVANRLLQLIEDAQISDRFAAEGPKVAEAFSEERIATLWEQNIMKICQRNQHGCGK